MLPEIALVSGLRKFRKFCKIKVVSEEWAKIPIVKRKAEKNILKFFRSFAYHFNIGILNDLLYYMKYEICKPKQN